VRFLRRLPSLLALLFSVEARELVSRIPSLASNRNVEIDMNVRMNFGKMEDPGHDVSAAHVGHNRAVLAPQTEPRTDDETHSECIWQRLRGADRAIG